MSSVVAMTVDLEPDCPPFLSGFRGVEHGLPALLDLLGELAVPATFFTTGEVARRYPGAVRRLLDAGHELGCHGMTHTSFARMDSAAAREEIERSASILREFAPVRSFRAPYLQFPGAYVRLLEDAGFQVDSSQAKYKLAYYRDRPETRLTRIPASVTSSVLRIPTAFRVAYLSALTGPVVLFVHPWEMVDLRDTGIRWDCRAGTGAHALDSVRQVIRLFRDEGACFLRIADAADAAARSPGERP